jgi:LPS export ABC transporter protein LptC
MSPRRLAKLLAGFGAVALVAVIIVTVVVVRSRSARQALGKAGLGVLPGALLRAHNFHWTQMKGGRSQWVLSAGEASYSNDKTSLTLSHPELSMTASDGKQVALSAKSAKLTMEGNHIKNANLSGGIVAHYGDFVMTTDEATFSPESDELEAPGAVSISGPEISVLGIGMSGHPKAEIFELHKQVTTRITPRQTSDQAKVS